MGAFLYPVFNFFAANKWARYALLAVTGVGLIKLFFMRHDGKIKKLERKAIKQRQAEVRVETIERTQQIIEKEQTYADRALESRDSGESYSDYDSLPDDLKAIARGRPGPR